MLSTIFNKSWMKQPTKQQLFGHLPPITQTINVRQARYASHRSKSKDELINDIFLWTPTHRWTSVGQPVKIYIQQFCADTWYSLEEWPKVVVSRHGWPQKINGIHVEKNILLYSLIVIVGDHSWRDLEIPFSIATTPKCRGGHYSFPWIAPLYPWYIPYNAEC